MTISVNATSANHQPAANTDAVATIANGKGYKISGIMVHFGYSDAPTAGALIIKDGATTISQVPVTSKGPGFLPLDGFRTATKDNTLSATLVAGGVGISGFVSISGEYE